MPKFDRLKAEKQEADQQFARLSSDMDSAEKEWERLCDLIQNVDGYIQDIDKKFEAETQLKGKDVSFLFLGVALQLVRQYLITNFPERKDDQTAAKESGKPEEHSNRNGERYHPSIEEIISNPVPFDANVGSGGALSGAGFLGHRGATVGHDPVLGLVVGTSNIATSTLTTWTWESYHIVTNDVKVRNGFAKRDVFGERAETPLVFSNTYKRLFHEGVEGKEAVALSLIKEIQHLQSDVHSKKGLGLPVITTFNPQLAGKLAQYGVDWGNVVQIGKQGLYQQLINWLIAVLHCLSCGELDSDDMPRRQVRTRKVILYSDVIASSSNLLLVGGLETAALVNLKEKPEIAAKLAKKGARYLDIGGLLNTTYRLLNDPKYVAAIKKEFIINEWYKQVHAQS